jgi:hypothetical protein
MRFLVVILLSIFIGSASAQSYQPFPTTDAGYWLYSFKDSLGFFPTSPTEYYLYGDTIISSNNYKRVGITNAIYTGAIREANKVIYFVPDTSNVEVVLYDFNLLLGDTVVSTYGNHTCDPDTFIVQNVDSIVCSDGFHRRLYLGNNIQWVEGIGSYNYLLEPFNKFCLSGNDSLLCMRSDNFTLDGWDCSVGIVELLSTDVNIHPNPTQDWITVSLEEGTATSVSIRNSLGQLLLSDKKPSTNQVELDLSSYPTGIYFLQLEVDGQVITKKVVKE